MKKFLKATALAAAIVIATATAAFACTISTVTATTYCDSAGVSVVDATAHGVGQGDNVVFSNSVTSYVQDSSSQRYIISIPKLYVGDVTVSAYATNGENRSRNTATVTVLAAACTANPSATLKYIRCSDPRYAVTLDNTLSTLPVTFNTYFRRIRSDVRVHVTKTVAPGDVFTFSTVPLHKGSALAVWADGIRLAFVSPVSKDTCP